MVSVVDGLTSYDKLRQAMNISALGLTVRFENYCLSQLGYSQHSSLKSVMGQVVLALGVRIDFSLVVFDSNP